MRTLTFYLKQHTPMIHFQASQQGATLRASDVKPRFDRWLIQKVFKSQFEECKKYLVGYPGDSNLNEKFKTGFRSLNYKMKITEIQQGKTGTTHICNNKGKEILDYPMYFGEKMGTVIKDCEVSFLIPDSSDCIYENICKYFSEFINSHNFGTRSSKGYGSYSISSSNDSNAELNTFPAFSINLIGKNWKSIEKQIELFHKTIRSGINYTQPILDKETKKPLKDEKGNDRKTGYYFKSMLYSFIENKRHWDKKIIKNHFLKNKKKEKEEITIKQDYRDCLGLSTNESWMKYNMSISKKIKDIDRYASPIIFKPAWIENDNWKVYIILNDIPEKYKNKKVTISAKKLKKERNTDKLIDNFEKMPLEMTISNDFSIKEYFKFLCSTEVSKKNFNIYETTPKQNGEIESIINFYNQLRNASK